jgi:uncharacterized small protein (DUF1192 family)
MNVNEKNAHNLNNEQIRIRSVIDEQQGRIARLEAEIVSLRAEMLQVRAMAAAAIGRGSTGGFD